MPSSSTVVVGVAAMDKKATSRPATEIFDRLRAYGEFRVVLFGNDTLLHAPIEEWPLCDVLIGFASTGYPLEKVIRYAELRKPFCVNDLPSQRCLMDRFAVYAKLREASIPTPQHVLYSKKKGMTRVVTEEGVRFLSASFDDGDDGKGATSEERQPEERFIPFPVVEKPRDADDHCITIYYGPGNGKRNLFRKIKNKSSEFVACDVMELRTAEDEWLYERFLPNGRDIKLYTLGPTYTHAETRKSPTIDGLVLRDRGNKELRLLTKVTPQEREVARRITQVFQQRICGFDMVRWRGESVVIDVNGWSFVKNDPRYYDKAARILRRLSLAACAFRKQQKKIEREEEEKQKEAEEAGDEEEEEEEVEDKRKQNTKTPTMSPPPEGTFLDGEKKDVLRCLVSLFRHADRDPKKKIKMKTSNACIVALLPSEPMDPAVFEKKVVQSRFMASECQGVVSVLQQALAEEEAAEAINGKSGEEATDQRPSHTLRQILYIVSLAMESLKIQVRALKLGADGRISKALLICKWGGSMTHSGRLQTRQYVPVFWDEMLRPFPPVPDVHAEFVYEKEYTMTPETSAEFMDPSYRTRRASFLQGARAFCSMEDRVRSTAETFVSQMLGVPVSELPPESQPLGDEGIQDVLNDLPKIVKQRMATCKQLSLRVINGIARAAETEEKLTERGLRCLQWLGDDPKEFMRTVLSLLKKLCRRLAGKCERHLQKASDCSPGISGGSHAAHSTVHHANGRDLFEEYEHHETQEKSSSEDDMATQRLVHGLSGSASTPSLLMSPCAPVDPNAECCDGESWEQVYERYDKIINALYDPESDTFDTTQISPALDMVTYDSVHNQEVCNRLRSLYRALCRVGEFVVPQEYGVSEAEKLEIGKSIVNPLAHMIRDQLESGIHDDAKSRCFLYFSSRSHVHALRNWLMLSGFPSNETVKSTIENMQLNYLSHCVFRLYEDVSCSDADPHKRFYVNIQVSPGAALDPFIFGQDNHVSPVSRPIPITGRMPWGEFLAKFNV